MSAPLAVYVCGGLGVDIGNVRQYKPFPAGVFLPSWCLLGA